MILLAVVCLEAGLGRNLPARFDSAHCCEPVEGQAGQGSQAGVSGSVRDLAGKVVAGAKVTAKNEATRETRETTTNPEGAYTLNTLSPGSYTLTVTCGGFKAFSKQSNTLTAGKVLIVNVTLEREPPGVSPGAEAQSGGSELSLGEVARRMRQERQARPSPTPPIENESLAETAPSGFSPYTHPEANFTVLLPNDREALSKPILAGGTDRTFRINSLPGNPGEPFVVWLSLTKDARAARTPGPSLLNTAEEEILRLGNETINLREDMTIHGCLARLVHFETAGRGLMPQSYLAGFILVPQGWIAARCWASKERFPAVENACRTIITSIQPLPAPASEPPGSKP
jgi:hypothetical protein